MADKIKQKSKKKRDLARSGLHDDVVVLRMETHGENRGHIATNIRLIIALHRPPKKLTSTAVRKHSLPSMPDSDAEAFARSQFQMPKLSKSNNEKLEWIQTFEARSQPSQILAYHYCPLVQSTLDEDEEEYQALFRIFMGPIKTSSIGPMWVSQYLTDLSCVRHNGMVDFWRWHVEITTAARVLLV
ncbi:non-specific lipid-transfer protein [Striga asiatica]|uniref:Non-specific lipid-transfer protein n=1 Tax=Striga asiatica TaxID=4170 RepID=A0A5A7P752_STRAF|nr:non-specific lipid-transfer protein [Striga asiatica]